MEKYSEYKDSGIVWLGKIPEKWSIFRIDWVSSMVRGNTSFKKDELLKSGEYVALQYGKTYKVDEVNDAFKFFVNSEFYKKNQIVRCGNTILISTSETIEDLGHSCFYNRDDLGLIGGEQILLRPNTKLIIEKYLYYYSKIFNCGLREYATGLKVFRFNIDDLKKIFIAIPPLQEQTQIANYLDDKTKAIDQKINLLQKKITHYKAYRKTLINETVTKGLDKSVKLKDSGIDWIGQIPEHWEVKRIKDIFYTLAGGTPSTKVVSFWSGTIPWIPSGAVQNGEIYKSIIKSHISDEALIRSSTKMARKDSILIALTGATCSNIGYLNFDTTINQSIVSIDSNKKNVSHRFYFYFLISAKEKIRTLMTGGAQGGINQGDVKYFKVCYTTKNEQQQIANYLDTKTATIDKIVKNIETQISTLKELRKTLINEVVTGKVKVTD